MRDHLLGALLIACALPAAAGPANPERARDRAPVAELARCAGIETDARRLACFDALAARVAAAGADGPGTGVSTGASTSPPSPAARSEAAPPASETRAAQRVRIERIEERPYGERIFFLDNGERWTEQTRERTRFRVGDAARLQRTSLGGFVLVRDAGGATRVRRMQ